LNKQEQYEWFKKGYNSALRKVIKGIEGYRSLYYENEIKEMFEIE